MNEAALTILPGDTVSAPGGPCSRCGGEIGPRLVVLVWNDIQFLYCAKCQPKVEAS
jgi:hypothetical protein